MYEQNLAIVDDRSGMRESARAILQHAMSDGWHVVAMAPLDSIADYAAWLETERISVLVLDEKLQEQSDDDQHVTYNGSQVARVLRQRGMQIPIFIVSAHAKDDDLMDAESDVEDVIQRDVFEANPERYAQRFARAAQRFADSRRQELARLGELAEKESRGLRLTRGEKKEIAAIRTHLELAHDEPTHYEYSALILKLQALADRGDELVKVLSRENPRPAVLPSKKAKR